MDTSAELPENVRVAASLSYGEYAWPIDTFLSALDNAAAASLACVGGQFQFIFPDGIAEMYWLSADSEDRGLSEPWGEYVERVRIEVKTKYEKRIATVDFIKEAEDWPFIKAKMQLGVKPLEVLYFCAYFNTEEEYERLLKAQ